MVILVIIYYDMPMTTILSFNLFVKTLTSFLLVIVPFVLGFALNQNFLLFFCTILLTSFLFLDILLCVVYYTQCNSIVPHRIYVDDSGRRHKGRELLFLSFFLIIIIIPIGFTQIDSIKY